MTGGPRIGHRNATTAAKSWLTGDQLTLPFALNHMTVARASYAGLLDIAAATGCVGVEVRNDLPQPLFDGLSPQTAGQMARDRGVRLLALAEVKRFNDWSADKARDTRELIALAVAAGAEAVSLIPRNDNQGMNEGERQANLRVALRDIVPMLRDAGIRGFVEPLGFETCALRSKQDTVDAIDALDAGDVIHLVHDTFHHHLAGGGPVFARQTGIVHVSGVIDPVLASSQMSDADRVLVDAADRLGNITQIQALRDGGYQGPISFEVFAPHIHSIADPVNALQATMDFVRSSLTADAA